MSSNIFLIIALITTGIFVIQFILSIFFGDIDTEIDVDADISRCSVLLKDLPILVLALAGTCIWQDIRMYILIDINRYFLCVGCLVFFIRKLIGYNK